VGACHQRRDVLIGAARRLTERRFDALHYEGPGTDLKVGLLPGATWQAAAFETAEGLPHMPNLPTEEVFTTPDPDRTEGRVRSTTPLVLSDGTVVRDLVVVFEGGRATSIEAATGGETLRTITSTDEGAARLGEVALVDGAGRIGALQTIFYDTLLDENAASHVAFGQGFPFLLKDPARSNTSQIHIDFMIGSPEMRVTGITAGAERVPVLADGAWLI
jgi:aminopeptidase